jgi:hypothetical protein
MNARWTVLLIGIVAVAGLVAASAILGLGPSHSILCGTGSVPDRVVTSLASRLGGGEVDSPSGSYCETPQLRTWLLAAGVLLVVSGAVAAGLRRRSPKVAGRDYLQTSYR